MLLNILYANVTVVPFHSEEEGEEKQHFRAVMKT